MAADTNTVALVGRPTKDAELRHTSGGTSVLNIRLAFSTRQKRGEEWADKSNFVDVTVFGNRAESLAQYVTKGQRIAVSGRLEWSEWEADGGKRQKLEIVANEIQLLGDGKERNGGAQGSSNASDLPTHTEPVTHARADRDIPF